MSRRTQVAQTAAKATAALSRTLTHGGGTSLPGVVGLKVDPRLVRHLSSRLQGSVVVTGTNGKTTTARCISAMLAASGHPLVHNQAGSNLLRGIASSLSLRLPLSAGKTKPWGLFEVDEATMPAACRELRPAVVIVTNIFRDQLDRYGELRSTAAFLRKALEHLPKTSTVLLNADDPLVASLGKDLPQHVIYYGIEDTAISKQRLPHAADSLTSPVTGALLRYDAVFVGHLGHYRSPDKSFARPRPDVALTKLSLRGLKGSTLSITVGKQTTKFGVSLPGIYNAYNALAAFAVSAALDIPAASAAKAVTQTAAAFGRIEKVKVGRKDLLISLIKNPIGTNEVLETLALDKPKKHFLILINDNFADGQDVSWLWDADFEKLFSQASHITVGGLRAYDMALRLKYAGGAEEDIAIYEDLGQALAKALDQLPAGGTLYVLPTYTAMLELRRHLADQGYLNHYLA